MAACVWAGASARTEGKVNVKIRGKREETRGGEEERENFFERRKQLPRVSSGGLTLFPIKKRGFGSCPLKWNRLVLLCPSVSSLLSPLIASSASLTLLVCLLLLIDSSLFGFGCILRIFIKDHRSLRALGSSFPRLYRTAADIHTFIDALHEDSVCKHDCRLRARVAYMHQIQ